MDVSKLIAVVVAITEGIFSVVEAVTDETTVEEVVRESLARIAANRTQLEAAEHSDQLAFDSTKQD